MASCERVGIAVRTPYDWAERSPEFAEEMKKARDIGDKVMLGTLEKEIGKRALAGHKDPGSTNLLMFRTKRLDPAYRDNAQVNIATLGPAAIMFALEPNPLNSQGDTPSPCGSGQMDDSHNLPAQRTGA